MTPIVFVSFVGGKSGVILSDVISCRINYGYYIPADIARVTLFSKEHLEQISEIEIHYNNKIIFIGYVDSQQTHICQNGFTLSLTARSLEGRLIDNEAAPQIYTDPTPYVICENHLKKHGIMDFAVNMGTTVSEFIIEPSTTEWEVVKGYFTKSHNQIPYIDMYRILRLRSISDKADHIISNRSADKDALRYRSVSVAYKSSHLISEVYLINSETGSITSTIVDEEVWNMGINRARYREYDPDNINSVTARFRERLKEQHTEVCVYTFELAGHSSVELGDGLSYIDSENEFTYDIIATEKEFIFDKDGVRNIICGIPRDKCY